MGREEEVVPRRAGFSQKDLETHGFTAGCAGCKSVLTGGRRQGHNEDCRRRLEKEMAGEDKIKRAAERRDEFAVKKVREDEEMTHEVVVMDKD
jgi:hypothetical protein